MSDLRRRKKEKDGKQLGRTAETRDKGKYGENADFRQGGTFASIVFSVAHTMLVFPLFRH